MCDNFILIQCPHCMQYMELIKNEINCAIYRHGMFKINGQQIDPHLSKELCDKLIEDQLIYGCGKPFQLFQNKNPVTKETTYYVEKCDYI